MAFNLTTSQPLYSTNIKAQVTLFLISPSCTVVTSPWVGSPPRFSLRLKDSLSTTDLWWLISCITLYHRALRQCINTFELLLLLYLYINIKPYHGSFLSLPFTSFYFNKTTFPATCASGFLSGLNLLCNKYNWGTHNSSKIFLFTAKSSL